MKTGPLHLLGATDPSLHGSSPAAYGGNGGCGYRCERRLVIFGRTTHGFTVLSITEEGELKLLSECW